MSKQKQNNLDIKKMFESAAKSKTVDTSNKNTDNKNPKKRTYDEMKV